MLEIIKEDCCGCYACYNACNSDAIKMVSDNEGFWYPQIDESKCIACGACERACPNLSSNPIKNELCKAYGAYTIDDEIRKQSSSGGIFTLIADVILDMNGVVYGASFDMDFSIKHTAIKNKDDLYKLRGSKYVQSNIGITYTEVKENLKNGKAVFFTGTPCQISGLYKFLGKKYDNLYTQDLICHGVPSPLVWKKYVSYREKCASADTRRIFFRNKNYGWKIFSVEFIFKNSTEYIKILTEDFYMRGFLQNLFLRPSCYNCKHKGIERNSDITLADFWGVEEKYPQIFDNKGTSLILVHSKKGQKLFNLIKNKLVYLECDNKCIDDNSSIVCSSKRNSNRQAFFDVLNKVENDELFEKYITNFTKEPFSAKFLIKTLLKKTGFYDCVKSAYKKIKK